MSSLTVLLVVPVNSTGIVSPLTVMLTVPVIVLLASRPVTLMSTVTFPAVLFSMLTCVLVGINPTVNVVVALLSL